MVTNFVPADEFLEYLEAARLLEDGGIEPSIDVVFWSMNGMYPFAWTPGSQKVIILMTDEIAQTITGQNVAQVNLYAVENGYQIFVFALPEHHASFLQMVRGEADRLYTRTTNRDVKSQVSWALAAALTWALDIPVDLITSLACLIWSGVWPKSRPAAISVMIKLFFMVITSISKLG